VKARIVSAAIELLNELGPHKVTTNHIIDALGISPGTLYYHYRNREQIILSIFQQISEDFDALFIENPPSDQITGLLTMIEKIYRLYFKYRFFYLNLSMLLDRDPVLAEAYRENYRIKRKKLEGLFSSLEEQGFIRPFESAEERDIFLQNQWLINDYWLSFQKAVGISDAEEMISKGILGYLAFIREYLTPRGRRALSTRHSNSK
jgi:AcrR family transcriptional regulator